MMTIYNIGAIITGTSAIIFVLKEEKKKALISYIVLLWIMLIDYMGQAGL